MEMNAFQCEDISVYKPPYLKTHLSSTNRTHLLYDKLFTKAPHLSFWNITYFRFTCPNFPTSAICFWCTHSNKGKCATWEYPRHEGENLGSLHPRNLIHLMFLHSCKKQKEFKKLLLVRTM